MENKDCSTAHLLEPGLSKFTGNVANSCGDVNFLLQNDIRRQFIVIKRFITVVYFESRSSKIRDIARFFVTNRQDCAVRQRFEQSVILKSVHVPILALSIDRRNVRTPITRILLRVASVHIRGQNTGGIVRFSNSFVVPLPPDRAWATLMDIEAVVPCVPGAELQERVDEQTYRGKVSVRLGPMALAFAGTARFEEIDEAAHSAIVKAQGSDGKGRGAAGATVRFSIEPLTDGSKVLIDTDLALSGSVAQFGRASGLIQGVANQITDQFAKTLAAHIAKSGDDGGAVESAMKPEASKPISGLTVLRRAVVAGLTNRRDGQ